MAHLLTQPLARPAYTTQMNLNLRRSVNQLTLKFALVVIASVHADLHVNNLDTTRRQPIQQTSTSAVQAPIDRSRALPFSPIGCMSYTTEWHIFGVPDSSSKGCLNRYSRRRGYVRGGQEVAGWRGVGALGLTRDSTSRFVSITATLKLAKLSLNG